MFDYNPITRPMLELYFRSYDDPEEGFREYHARSSDWENWSYISRLGYTRTADQCGHQFYSRVLAWRLLADILDLAKEDKGIAVNRSIGFLSDVYRDMNDIALYRALLERCHDLHKEASPYFYSLDAIELLITMDGDRVTQAEVDSFFQGCSGISWAVETLMEKAIAAGFETGAVKDYLDRMKKKVRPGDGEEWFAEWYKAVDAQKPDGGNSE